MQDGQINKTKCGPGYCTLSFDNDKSQKTVKAIRGTTDVPLSVNFKSDSPVAGSLKDLLYCQWMFSEI